METRRMNTLAGRALAAYYRSGAVLRGLDAVVREHDGHTYVVLTATAILVAVYRVRNDGPLKQLRRVPAAIRDEFDAGGRDTTQRADTFGNFSREQALDLIFRHTQQSNKDGHADQRGIIVVRRGEKEYIPLDELTDQQINRRLPSAIKKEAATKGVER